MNVLVDCNRGVYIPQFFAENCHPESWGIRRGCIEILRAGPHDPRGLYWEVWDDVLETAERNGYGLYENPDTGDLMTLPVCNDFGFAV